MNGLKLIDLTLMAATVLMMCAGQVLFKMVALRANEQQTYFNTPVLSLFFVALAVYGAATLTWIRVLQTVPLSLAYIFMSLSFVLVPAISIIVFRETLSLRSMIGAVVIVIGVIISASR